MLKNPDKKEKTVKKQVVAGFVIFRKTEEGVKYLFLYKRGEYWNFPKGHFEEGEESLDTALRETEEETGLKKGELHILPTFRAYEKFHFYSETEKIYDTVILYLAETKQARVTISLEEHSGYAWFLYPDAMKILRRYAETRRVLKQAHDFIRNQGRPPGFQKPNDNRPRSNNRRSYGQNNKRFYSPGARSGEKNPARPNQDLRRSGPPRRQQQGVPSRRQHPPFVRRDQNNRPLPPRP